MKPADAKDDAKPPHEIEALDYFVGIWTCKGRIEATPDTPAHDTKGTMICRWELGKFFLGLSEDDEQSLKFPRRRQMRGYWGYDPGPKLYTSGVFFYAAGASSGRRRAGEGTLLSFSGTMSAGGESFGMRQSFKQKNDAELIIRVDVVGPDGAPAKRLEEHCRREGEG
jgi:hypothetical protein